MPFAFFFFVMYGLWSKQTSRNYFFFVNRTEVWFVFYYIFCLLYCKWVCTVCYSVLTEGWGDTGCSWTCFFKNVISHFTLKRLSWLQPVTPVLQPDSGQNRKMYISSKVTTKCITYMFVLRTATASSWRLVNSVVMYIFGTFLAHSISVPGQLLVDSFLSFLMRFFPGFLHKWNVFCSLHSRFDRKKNLFFFFNYVPLLPPWLYSNRSGFKMDTSAKHLSV